MPRDLFRDVVVPSIRVGTKQWYTVPASVLVHTVAVLALIVVPLLATSFLPTPQAVLAFAALPAPPPPPPPPPQPPPSTIVEPVRTDINLEGAPTEAPTIFNPSEPMPPSPLLRASGPADGGIVAPSTRSTLDAPPPPPAQKVYRIGGDIREPKQLARVEPVYPAIAKAAKMQGPVYVDAIIGRDGRVRDAKAVNGAPYSSLREAAVAAVLQWIYSPTTLNGQPVEVQLSVVVHFQLK